MNNESSNQERRVHWDEQSIAKSMTPQFTAIKQTRPNFSKIKTHIIKSLRNQDYVVLAEWLNRALPDNSSLRDFFENEGSNILKHVLAYFRDLKILEFIKEHFPISSIQFSLRKGQFDALDEFFTSQAGAELFNQDDIPYRLLRVEKFKFLLNLDPRIVKEFIDNNQDKKYMTPKIKEDLLKAEADIEQTDKRKITCKMEV